MITAKLLQIRVIAERETGHIAVVAVKQLQFGAVPHVESLKVGVPEAQVY